MSSILSTYPNSAARHIGWFNQAAMDKNGQVWSLYAEGNLR
jgi:hypothetical protein